MFKHSRLLRIVCFYQAGRIYTFHGILVSWLHCAITKFIICPTKGARGGWAGKNSNRYSSVSIICYYFVNTLKSTQDWGHFTENNPNFIFWYGNHCAFGLISWKYHSWCSSNKYVNLGWEDIIGLCKYHCCQMLCGQGKVQNTLDWPDHQTPLTQDTWQGVRGLRSLSYARC